MTAGQPDPIHPDMPTDDGVAEPELGTLEVEGARLLGNEARARLRQDGFDDDEIDAWADAYYSNPEDGRDEGDVEGLVAWIAKEQAAGRSPG
jgi:hypothetical protein